MKTKNFLLPTLAIAMFAAPVIAQDYHEYENEIRGTIAQATVENTRQHKYLDLGFLRAVITEDISVNIDEIKIAAANSIADDQIPPIYQYDLMVSCIENNSNDVLQALLEGGFDPELGQKLGLTSLTAKTIENNNLKAFALTYPYNRIGAAVQLVNELTEMDESLIKRFLEFFDKTKTNKTFKKLNIDNEKLKEYEQHQKINGEYRYTIYKIPAATKTIKVTE